MRRRLRIPRAWPALAALLVLCATAAYAMGHGFKPVKYWLMAGQNLSNTRYQEKDSQIKKHDLDRLDVKWVFEANERISATATVDKDYVYVPDWDQYVYKLRRDDGSVVWAASIGDYTGLPGDFSRNSPALWENLVIVGDLGGIAGVGAKLLALDRETGALVWMKQIDDFPFAIVTQSPVVYHGVVYVGVSSFEPQVATFPGYPCCSFRGNLQARDVHTGELLWKTYFTPDPPPGHDFETDGSWYAGTAVWGSTVAVDEDRNVLYVGTGQNYMLPPDVLQCVDDANQNGGDPRLCNDPANLFDSILAIDPDTGAILWGKPAIPFDAWNVACLIGPPENCPSPTGSDYDISQGPMLFKTASGRELVGAGQKSGIFWVHDRDTGEEVWHTQVGPGGLAGGLQWGSSTDGRRIYVAEANSDHKPWDLVHPAPDSPSSTTGGGWSALDAATGHILWQTADPLGGVAWSPTAINKDGLMFACSMDDVGHMYIFDAATGRRLWSFASGGSCVAGAALVDKDIYWGSGYVGPGPLGVPNNQLYAFSTDGGHGHGGDCNDH